MSRTQQKEKPMSLFIFDIDGTLADLTHRLHFITGETKDWQGFHDACPADKPIFEVISIARALDAAGRTIVYSTGRMASGHANTVAWLRKYRLPQCDRIYMRPTGDFRDDTVVKLELLNMIKADYPSEVICGAFEDRDRVVEMYRANGVRAFQVAKGTY
jgi:phosphoglycolate phosphatase-like HAD superfamily hydrolase